MIRSVFPVLAISLSLSACSAPSDASPGAGSGGTGAVISTGGSNAAGGSDAAGAGGNDGAGGNAATGGKTAAGGNSMTGGASGTGGDASTGGNTIVGDGSIVLGEPVVVVPLGDSITFGANSDNSTCGLTQECNGPGYRRRLLDGMVNAGWEKNDISFVGWVKDGDGGSSGPGDSLAVLSGQWAGHEGYPGGRIDHVAALIAGGDVPGGGFPNQVMENAAPRPTGTIATHKPDIVLSMLGTNDLIQDNLNNMSSYERMVDYIRTTSPETHILVAEIPDICLRDPDKNCGDINDNGNMSVLKSAEPLNSQIRAMVEARASSGKVHLVDMNAAIDHVRDAKDGVHPHNDGYQRMADVWLAAVLQVAQ